MPRRKKVSTTISPESYSLLRQLIRSGEASNLAEAIDVALDEKRRSDNRARLDRAMDEYFDSLTPDEIDEENRLGKAISASSEINADE